MTPRLRVSWAIAAAAAVGVRLWNVLAGPLMWGYDAGGHLQYVLHLDVYGGLPWADQGWSLFHPPLHYALGWLLARGGDAEVVMRGLPLLASAASLGMAALTAGLVARLWEDRPALPLLAFCAVAFLPVQLSASAMPGNELTQAFLTTCAVVSFIANERREAPSRVVDLRTGALLGLALLAKHNALVALAALGAAQVSLALLAGASLRGLGVRLGRFALVAGVALAMAAPIYARNVAAFGTPLPTAGDHFPLVRFIESQQPPGERSWVDYIRVSPALFTRPDPVAPHLLHSVWGSLYLSSWAEVHLAPPERTSESEYRWRSLLAILGLLPSALALLGAGLAASDALRGRRRASTVTLLALCAAGAAAAVAFSWRTPTWAALKASYLLFLSLPYAIFLCHGALRAARTLPAAVVVAALGCGFLVSAVASTAGVAVERRDSVVAAAGHFAFGEYEAARRILGAALAHETPTPVLLEMAAAVELAAGEPALARELQRRAIELEKPGGTGRSPQRNTLALALALEGDLTPAQRIFDGLVRSAPTAEARTNRGAVRAARGNLVGAERDLTAAVEKAPELTVAWLNLAQVRAAQGRAGPAREAFARAAEQACRPPRGTPHATGGGGFALGSGLLLLWDEDGLRLALPDFYRGACAALRAQESRSASSRSAASRNSS